VSPRHLPGRSIKPEGPTVVPGFPPLFSPPPSSTAHHHRRRARSGQIDHTVSHASLSRTFSARSRRPISPGALALPPSPPSVTKCRHRPHRDQSSPLLLRFSQACRRDRGELLVLITLSIWPPPVCSCRVATHRAAASSSQSARLLPPPYRRFSYSRGFAGSRRSR
jgi:hypothetical protein